MGLVIKALILISMVVCLTNVAYAISGQAIVYSSPYVRSTEQGHVMIAKAHSSLFTNGRACGRRYRVRCISGINKAIHDACTGNTVDVMVIDHCESCAMNDLELSREAFARIAPLALGRVNIEYEHKLADVGSLLGLTTQFVVDVK